MHNLFPLRLFVFFSKVKMPKKIKSSGATAIIQLILHGAKKTHQEAAGLVAAARPTSKAAATGCLGGHGA